MRPRLRPVGTWPEVWEVADGCIDEQNELVVHIELPRHVQGCALDSLAANLEPKSYLVPTFGSEHA